MNSETDSPQRYSLVAIVLRMLSAALIIFVVVRIADPAGIWQAMSTLATSSLVTSVCLHATIVMALAWRWAVLVRATGPGVSYATALRVTFVSTALNLTLPTSVGGDIGRVWLGKRHGVALLPGSAAAVLDRAIGLFTLVMMVACSAFYLGSLVTELVLATVLALGALLLVAAFRWAVRLEEINPIRRFAEATGIVLENRRTMLLTHGLSLASHVIAALIASSLAYGLNLPLSPMSAVLLFPAVLLVTAIPISIGGWGLRELAAIPLLAMAGLDAESATAVALLFGLTQLATALIGSLVLSAPLGWRAAT